MITLESIQHPISKELEEFNRRFKQDLKSRVSLLNIITRYLHKQKGKQIRPLFVLHAAKLLGEINDSTYTAATLIELLHTASLVHDDVVDESHRRRGMFSINALWKNKIAVLVGDFMLSRGMLIALERKEYNLLEIVSEAVKKMSEGELLQLEKARKLDIDEDIYFSIIKNKTASLIAACCACGSATTTSNIERIDLMKQFGENVGIAFQLKDDLFDYQKYNQTGKPTGTDLKDQKITLPIIYLLQQSNFLKRREVIRLVKGAKNNKNNILRLSELVSNSGGLDYTESKMIYYKERALDLLQQFPDNTARKALMDLVTFTIERTH